MPKRSRIFREKTTNGLKDESRIKEQENLMVSRQNQLDKGAMEISYLFG
jgi:hypothetical protein